MKFDRVKWAAFVVLLLVLAAFGWFMVPAHVTSLWMDREFTDWISPIANRLDGGARLYTDGLHLPMPPLPYVVVHLLHPGGAIWIQENLLNSVFQAATILLLYLMLARRVGAGLAFAACLCAVPVFLSLEKSILYDSMAQFLVAAGGGLCAGLVESDNAGGRNSPRGPAWWRLGLLGLVLGLLTLCKQSTGLGAFIGVCAALLWLPGASGFPSRCRNVALVVLFTATTVCLIALCLSSWVSFPGMMEDVFLTGSEPKGGPARILANLAHYAWYLAKATGCAAVLFYACSSWLRRKFDWRMQADELKAWLNLSGDARAMKFAFQGWTMLVVLLVSGLCFVGIYALSAQGAGGAIVTAIWFKHLPDRVLDLGLVAGLVLAVVAGIGKRCGPVGGLGVHPLAPFVMVYFMAAVFHTLSVPMFRWTFDNNPLIVVALVFLFSPIAAEGIGWVRAAKTGWVCVCVVLMWSYYFWPFKDLAACTESWPEIKHLAGAWLRPEAQGMRELVKIVQGQADTARHETVLLLPDDPNVEAWIGRERPALSSAILFTDQYWDRYVERDFAALLANPPKVIVIEPRNYWRRFSQAWHPDEEGVIRLIDLVQAKLLPGKYEMQFQQRINYRGGEDFMDVYVRLD